MSYEIKLRNPEEDEVLRRIEDRFDVPPIEDSLRDSVVIVTGGTTGIGRGCVHGFMGVGAHVVFCGRDEALRPAVEADMNRRYPNQKCIFKIRRRNSRTGDHRPCRVHSQGIRAYQHPGQ